MPALAGTRVEEHCRPARVAEAGQRPPIGTAPVVPAIHGHASGNAIDPAKTAFRIAVRLGPSGRLAIQRARQYRPRAAQSDDRRGPLDHGRMEATMHKHSVAITY